MFLFLLSPRIINLKHKKMEEDIYKYRMLLTEDLMFKKPDTRLIYKSFDGKEFYDRHEAKMHDRIASRKIYYEHLFKNRNWFMRFFNIKPSMKFYDEQCIRAGGINN